MIVFVCSSCTTTYLGRMILWNLPGIDDYVRFPYTIIPAAPVPTIFPVSTSTFTSSIDDLLIPDTAAESNLGVPLLKLLEETQTTAFIIYRNGEILYERYLNDYARDSINRSFSVAKSYTAALVGIALDQGLIGNIRDPVLKYLPDAQGTNIEDVTIEHLLLMNPGWSYTSGSIPWNDDAILYYTPRIRKRVMGSLQGDSAPGDAFIYNTRNTHPSLNIWNDISGALSVPNTTRLSVETESTTRRIAA